MIIRGWRCRSGWGCTKVLVAIEAMSGKLGLLRRRLRVRSMWGVRSL